MLPHSVYFPPMVDVQEQDKKACRFWPTVPEYDRHLFGEGRAYRIHHYLGAHWRKVDGVEGVSFALWAPNARKVAAVGTFNRWDGRENPLRPLGSSGIWEGFIPDVRPGALYKFELIDARGNLQLRTDPYALAYEIGEQKAAVVMDENGYKWGDDSWLCRRERQKPFQQPITIYEVHLGSWRRIPEENGRPLTYREAAPLLAEYCESMGFTHVELLPITEFPYDGSWGYQATGYFAPTARHGSADDFKFFVDTLHQANLGVILDWVPAHFPKDRFALAELDGTCLYEHGDCRQGEHRGWGTLIFNYGRNEVRNFLLCSALGWCERYHLDGLRVDAVSAMIYRDYGKSNGEEWVPNARGGRENLEALEFLRELNVQIHGQFPGTLTIAEEATSFPGVTTPVCHGGLGFDCKWSMGWMHDTLNYFATDPIHRKHVHNLLTFTGLYQYSEHFILALSHDEVVHGKGSLFRRMPSDDMNQKAHMLRSLYGWMMLWPGKKSLFMGGEFGQPNEWDHNNSLDWHLLQYLNHRGIQRWLRDLNFFYHNHPWLAHWDDDPAGFRWVDPDNGDHSVLSFLRCGKGKGEWALVVGNFTPVPRDHYHLGVPVGGEWLEVLNGNALLYGGNGSGNYGETRAIDGPCHGMPHHLSLHLPPHSVIVFLPRRDQRAPTSLR